jgi:uncharacterized protein YndB with AHSA1/START domain
MTHEFEVREEIELAATPEQVWQAIATGPGVDSWFMGHTEIEPRDGGATQMTLMGETGRSTVTAWEPGKRFSFRAEPNPDGTFMAFEYLIEGREGAGTVLRFVHSGILGDDWEDQYEGLRQGDRMYLQKLAVYLERFPDRTAVHSSFLPGPAVPDDDRAWAAFASVLGLTDGIVAGAPVRLGIDPANPVDGVVEFVREPSFIGVRTAGQLYMFVHGYGGMMVVEYHSFEPDADHTALDQAWQSWLAGSLGS